MRARSILLILVLVAAFPFAQPAAHAAQQRCTLVELNPGYPGYRGMITGLKGIGDFQCLQQLERQDPTFDRTAEDTANRRAAVALEIRGGPSDWTWENWMEIEIERGMVPQCYACLLVDPSIYPLSNGAQVPSDDPRLITGMLEGYGLETYILNQLGGRSTSSREGIYWRVGAAFAYLDYTLNAPETVDALKFLIGEWNGIDVDGDGRFSTLTLSKTQREFLVRGGYVSMTGQESYNDQLFQALAVAYLFSNSGAPGAWATGTQGMFDNAISACRLDLQGTLSIGHCVAQTVFG
jgi:hypothetical protein